MSKKVSYIDMINEFWQRYSEISIVHMDVVLYFYLLNECNKKYWENPFQLQSRQIESMLDTSRNTVSVSRRRLRDHGLIEYKEGVGRGPTTYLIKGLPITNEELSKAFSVTSCVISCVTPELHNGDCVTSCVTSELHKSSCVIPCVTSCVTSELHNDDSHLIYIKTNKTNKTTREEDVVVAEKSKSKKGGKKESKKNSKTDSLFTEKELTPRKTKKEKPTSPVIPTIEDVMKYFLQVNANERLEDYERSAQLFFDTYNADGWMNKYGRPVANWESEANKWIFYREESEKKNKVKPKPTSYENNQSDRFSERRSTEPSTTQRKGFKSSF